MSYVNQFVRGLPPPRWLRISSTVDGLRPVTGIVGKPAPVARDFDWISSPCSDGFRLCARERWCTFGDAGVIGPFVA